VVAALGADFFARPAREVAPELVGCVLTRGAVSGRIVEVERYEQWDAASHSFRGARTRARTMFGPAGHLYVYRSYGIHWCVNVVCGDAGFGSAILLRAAEPTEGVDLMRARRGVVATRDLCRGPGRLSQAFGITGVLDGVRLGEGGPADRLEIFPRGGEIAVVRSPRIGIRRDAGRLWRYSQAGSGWVSGRRPPPPPVRASVAA
jgi:DNA-3-methyladenine glycosylase